MQNRILILLVYIGIASLTSVARPKYYIIEVPRRLGGSQSTATFASWCIHLMPIPFKPFARFSVSGQCGLNHNQRKETDNSGTLSSRGPGSKHQGSGCSLGSFLRPPDPASTSSGGWGGGERGVNIRSRGGRGGNGGRGTRGRTVGAVCVMISLRKIAAGGCF